MVLIRRGKKSSNMIGLKLYFIVPLTRGQKSLDFVIFPKISGTFLMRAILKKVQFSSIKKGRKRIKKL